MILQALYDLYQRRVSQPNSKIAREGFEWKELPFIIVLDAGGKFIRLEDTREKVNEKLRGRAYLVPRAAHRSGSKAWKSANLLWDHYGYILGHPKSDGQRDIVMAQKQHGTFVKTIQDLPDSLRDDPEVRAVLGFSTGSESQSVRQSELFKECANILGCNMSFRVEGRPSIVAEAEVVREFVRMCVADESTVREDETDDGGSQVGVCLITGQRARLARIHSRTSINKDTKSFVAVQRSSGYDSYGKEQAYNAPVSTSAEFAYTTALKALLARDSPNKMYVGSAVTVFWADRATRFEQDFPRFFAFPRKDDPDQGILGVRASVESIVTGLPAEELAAHFFVLGLSPNAARISVRFWHRGTVGEFARNIQQHFQDLDVVLPKGYRGGFSLMSLLSSLVLEGKVENLAPNLSGAMVRSILSNTPYPNTLAQQCIRRIRAERAVTPVRAALLKAALSRRNRHINHRGKEITVALDPTNTDVGYRLGRLFAALEKIQEDAHPKINATIRDRYYGAASSNPVAVFPQLLKLKNHHLSKLDNPGYRIAHERVLGEIFSEFPPDMPAHLSMDQQARFAIGYYHQRQEFFKPKSEGTSNNDSGIKEKPDE